MKSKTIDINQRIPLETLHVALVCFLDDNYSNDYIIEQLRLDFNGENRLKKALRIVNKIILKNPIWVQSELSKEQVKMALKNKSDRNLILISLLNTTFPFSFEVLKNFGKYFAVQKIINSETIKKSISNIYGGNRATENGIYSVVPMFIEAGLFSRPKVGLYQFNEKLKISNKITYEVYVASYKINNEISELQDYQLREPYFFFLQNYH